MLKDQILHARHLARLPRADVAALPLGVKSASLIGLAPWRCSVITRAAVAMQFFFTFSRFARKCSLRSPLHFSLHFVLNCPSPVHQSQPRAPHSPVASCPSPNSFMFPASSKCFLSFIYTSLLAPRAPLLFVKAGASLLSPPFSHAHARAAVAAHAAFYSCWHGHLPLPRQRQSAAPPHSPLELLALTFASLTPIRSFKSLPACILPGSLPA